MDFDGLVSKVDGAPAWLPQAPRWPDDQQFKERLLRPVGLPPQLVTGTQRQLDRDFRAQTGTSDKCDGCGKRPCPGECGLCGELYCSRECLVKDWHNHREMCQQIYEATGGLEAMVTKMEMMLTLSQEEIAAAMGEKSHAINWEKAQTGIKGVDDISQVLAIPKDATEEQLDAYAQEESVKLSSEGKESFEMWQAVEMWERGCPGIIRADGFAVYKSGREAVAGAAGAILGCPSLRAFALPSNPNAPMGEATRACYPCLVAAATEGSTDASWTQEERAGALVVLGALYMSGGGFKEAEMCLSKAEKLRPEHPRQLILRAGVRVVMRDIRGSLADLEVAVRKENDPKLLAETKGSMARVYAMTGREGEALDIFEENIRQGRSEDGRAYFQRGCDERATLPSSLRDNVDWQSMHDAQKRLSRWEGRSVVASTPEQAAAVRSSFLPTSMGPGGGAGQSQGVKGRCKGKRDKSKGKGKSKDKSKVDARKCLNCLRTAGDVLAAGDGKRLRLCNGCEKVHYCSDICQKDHWRDHKAFCKANKPARSPEGAGAAAAAAAAGAQGAAPVEELEELDEQQLRFLGMTMI